MKFRCPECLHLVNTIPPTHKCPDCDSFSHDWLIDDWVTFTAIKHRHIRYNQLIIGLVLVNVLAALIFQSSNGFQWMLNLLFIPAAISWFYCRKELKAKAEYKGHRGNVVFPWFSGFGGF